jgi:hypothetical protein
MLSLVVPTPSDVLFQQAAGHFADFSGGVPLQIIHAGGPSRAANVAAALKVAQFPLIAVASPEVQLLSRDYFPRLLGHLQRFDAVGILGTLLVSGPGWHQSGPPYILGQHLYPLDNGSIGLVNFGTPKPLVPGAQALDGPMVAFRRALLEAVPYDPHTFTSQDYADVDVTYRAFRAGYQLAVACDLPMFLRKPHVYAPDWQTQNQRFREKHAGLPTLSPRKFCLLTLQFPTIAAALPYLTPAYWSLPAGGAS